MQRIQISVSFRLLFFLILGCLRKFASLNFLWSDFDDMRSK